MLFLNDTRFRAVFYQFVAISLVLLAGWAMYSTASANLEKQDIATGFGFLSRQAGFEISETAIAFQSTDSVGRAILVGVANTVKVSFLAVLFGTVIGLFVGIGRLSTNPLLSRLMLAYVEVLRNVPLLLYLLLWYSLIILVFPPVKQAIQFLPGFFLSNSGLAVPALQWQSGFYALLGAVAIGMAAALAAHSIARRRRIASGRGGSGWALATTLFLLPVVAVWASGQLSITWEVPELGRFRLTGGLHIRPEFVALLVGLALNLSASVAEIVRGGIQAVNRGQWEAAMALGLPRSLALRLVVLPQALRVIVPPLTNNYLSVFKNSSLAIAIGYPDLVMVSNTVMNQTGQAIETIAIFMGVYLGLSVLISVFMNWYNARVALKER